jgi:hypothetical protein
VYEMSLANREGWLIQEDLEGWIGTHSLRIKSEPFAQHRGSGLGSRMTVEYLAVRSV